MLEVGLCPVIIFVSLVSQNVICNVMFPTSHFGGALFSFVVFSCLKPG